MTKSQTFELKAARVTKETWPKPPEKHSDDRTARTFCDLPIAGSDARGISYWPQPTLPGFWRVMPDADDADAAEEFTPAHGGRRVRPRAGRTDPTLALKLDALLTDVLAPPEGGTDARDDVPVVELPATGPGNLMTIIYSGDGGWRDLDKTIGEYLAAHGVAVVGVDSLRYFWREMPARQVATDLARNMERYGDYDAIARKILQGLGAVTAAGNR